jgi:hypothetical protein
VDGMFVFTGGALVLGGVVELSLLQPAITRPLTTHNASTARDIFLFI